jgi:hypothetical protein
MAAAKKNWTGPFIPAGPKFLWSTNASRIGAGVICWTVSLEIFFTPRLRPKTRDTNRSEFLRSGSPCRRSSGKMKCSVKLSGQFA